MKYLLTVQFEFESDDDPAARNKSHSILGGLPLSNVDVKDPEIKLRCIYENKPPRSVDASLCPIYFGRATLKINDPVQQMPEMTKAWYDMT